MLCWLTREVSYRAKVLNTRDSSNASIVSYAIADGVAFAAPGTSEKGHIDVHFDVNTPGGHSSIPPKHTVREIYDPRAYKSELTF